MHTLITYDVSQRQPEVKKALQKRDYNDYWADEQKTVYYLPDTTLWKKNTTLSDAIVDIQAVIKSLNEGVPFIKRIELERCVCVSASPWVSIPGKPHKE